jgi:SAM-dependent methyltransferase
MPDKYYYPDDMFDVVECLECGLAFVNPRPDKLEISKYYPTDFYRHFKDQGVRYDAEIAFLEKLYNIDLDQWGKGKRMLDIGTANGDFPKRLKNTGWEVEGLEVSSNISSHEGFPIYHCELPDIPVSGPSYDLITAWAVFEHLHDPMSYFKKVASLLKPGGYFVFLVTNWKSAASRYLFREDPPRHLYFFSEETVIKYLELNGLKMIRHETNNKIYDGVPQNYIPWRIRKFLGEKYEWKDVPETRLQFLSRKKMQPGIISNVLFAVRHPLVVLDRLMVRPLTFYQIQTKTYKISIYTAQKTVD